MRLSHLLAAALFLSGGSALAASATVVSVEGEGKIGRSGAWRPAKAGETVGESEFLSLAPNAAAKVKLGDGTAADFQGKVIVPGRRLATQKSAGALLRFSQSLQKAAEAVVGVDVKGTAPGASKADEKTGRKLALGFMGEDTEQLSSRADFAEASLARNDLYDATDRAKAILAESGSSALEKRRAHLVLGQVHLEEGEFTNALKHLDAAAKELSPDELAARRVEKGKTVMDPEAYRSAALLHRGRAHQILGDHAKAEADYAAAITAFPKGTQAYQAHFYLGVIALEGGDRKAAQKHFAGIADMKDADNSVTADQTRRLKALARDLLKEPTL